MRRITASHEEYAEINLYMTHLNIIINSHMHNYPKTSINYTDGMAEFERLALVANIENTIDEWLEGGIIRDFITGG